jgi:CO/xanthine dehydrogenase FAD-binding subunit
MGDCIEHVAEAALANAQPLQHNAYKLPLATSLVRRALATLAAAGQHAR